MKLAVKRSTLRGNVGIPGSKSHTIRAVALGSLASGTSRITAPLESADTQAAVAAYRRLGAQIQCGREEWVITGTAGRIVAPGEQIDVQNSGTTLRIAAGSAALAKSGRTVMTGDHQIRSRPIEPLLRSLNDLGASCRSIEGTGTAPIEICGALRGGNTSIAAITSQYLTSLLINAPLARRDTRIEVTQLNEAPYVEITLRYLDEQEIQYRHKNLIQFQIKGGQSYHAFEKRIAADFSSATFFLCAGAILDADIVLEGLDFSDAQGDKAVVNVLQDMGADIGISDEGVTVKKHELHGITVDMNAIPDALPALAVTACFAQGTSRFHNVAQARLKETDRIAVMARELGKLGAQIEETPDGLIIHGGAKLTAAPVDGHHDHRVVMALSLAGMALEEELTITTAEAINVTFPRYVDLMNGLGAQMKVVEG